ncbi:DEAD/DEAH box helicase family protein [Spirosoma terrae]|uniref:DEAD/DEAH box helicase family protein n=1 Tax=Spirosoma terrae TaxID=1968276 RepID=A0A6L9L1K3_9BACT|nr:DEAD/DEAH box helicase family protein [Spirosoma terrae]NDU94230.1 DEAD/DEAH box helicase family protein [Spirosoma terrae]
MNRYVNDIAGRLSLRQPQRRSLELLDKITELIPPKRTTDVALALNILKSEFPTITDFEREFPSVCFSLATGVGKTRLMGAFIAYLHLAHGINNFFVLAPNLTIYDKLITDFTPNTPKYVFKGIAQFSTAPPEIITGETYNQRVGSLFDDLLRCKINVFNISKINAEIRGGKAPKIKQLSEYIGQSYFSYLANLPDLVLLMDESHRYRASAGVRSINELKPVLGLELTATPFMETNKGSNFFKNIIYDYPLANAMADSLVKEPAVVTRKDFNPEGMSPEAIEEMKLQDGVRLHESVKVDLETYARETGSQIVKPFLLVIARDTTHAGMLLRTIQSANFFEGRYYDKVIQVDSSTKEEEVIERLLRVEHTDEPTEIVIHVNMLKEGWDVTNLYTIVPLRAANPRVMIEQSIGRGLRLPYGKRTGVASVDRLNIIAHDRFQEIIDEARKPGSPIRIKLLELDSEQLTQKTKIIVSQSQLANRLGLKPTQLTENTQLSGQDTIPFFRKPEEQQIAHIAYRVIRTYENQPTAVPTLRHLQDPEIQAAITRVVEEQLPSIQLEISFENSKPSVSDVVAQTIQAVTQQSIDIPSILVVPKGEVQTGFHSFNLDLKSLNYQPLSNDLWIQHLRTNKLETISLADSSYTETRLENYIVDTLTEFDDVNYEEQADLLYELANQTVLHFQSYLDDESVYRVLYVNKKQIGQFIHAQMLKHAWIKSDTGYEVKISKGFTELKPSSYKAFVNEPLMDYKISPSDKSNMAKYIFTGFNKCLYPLQKFDSDSERVLAIILERDSLRWFKPAKGQFQITYRNGSEIAEYQPDFVAETNDVIYMLEPKKRSELDDTLVVAKKEAAEEWCKNATNYALRNAGKPWKYILVPHDAIAENKTLTGLANQFGRL